jgi:hypothetical protein
VVIIAPFTQPRACGFGCANLWPSAGFFDYLLGNGNQAPQDFQVQACLTLDGFRLRAVVAVFPA